ncbi:RNA polymerase sigma factor SigC [Saccharopolyspora erythraea]|uniref:RNA polymerase sigma factor SigC n=1 Tax=Saccharopolyspora erythraea TaxID=1836 RepID=UPI001BA44F9C|nr:RNA polymerase sigma factor SigC [Saccharopolyspora erythraea]QUH05001.1 RNA polymerase sigma factor SigC [Saccharopolyspora erythraea]
MSATVSRSAADDAWLTELALAAGTGDRRALEEFIRATQRDVWRFVAHLASVEQADDLAQETYVRVLRSLPRFAGRASARTWLLSIARRVVVDQVRYARSRPRTTAAVEWTTAAERPAPGFEDIVELNMLLAGLDEQRREVLLLTQVLGLSYQETADICGCPVGTVRSRVARAREELIAGTREESEETG